MRILFSANPDLNLIDGSSIWAQTFALALADIPGVTIDFLAIAPPTRDHLLGPMRERRNISIIDGPAVWRDHAKVARLKPDQMAGVMSVLDTRNRYDLAVVRGVNIASALLPNPDLLGRTWLYLTDITQNIADIGSDERRKLTALAQGCRKLLCQSTGFSDYWRDLVPSLPAAKIKIYTPVIPDVTGDLPPIKLRPQRAIYAGKFKSAWMTREMLEAWPDVRGQVPAASLVVLGDKIHDEPGDPAYAPRMKALLSDTAGVSWLGAQTRSDTQEEMRSARVGLSWRETGMDDTLEYSTKILEYGGAGCAAILNRNPLHESLLGADYPLYANTGRQFVDQLIAALTDAETAQRAADRLMAVAKAHQISTRVSELRQWLAEDRPAARAKGRTTVLVAGHDLRFFEPLQKALEASGQFQFITDKWTGHSRHDDAISTALLSRADAVFCEWCLGNLVWYAKAKRSGQRLVARFHLQEVNTPHLANADWNAIDHIGFVGEGVRRQAELSFGFPKDRTSVIPNLLDRAKFAPLKKTADARFTLGIIGVTPSRKRLDLAVDLLSALLRVDDRYCLRVKGPNPLSYEWLVKRDAERAYYSDLIERINRDERLRYRIIFDPAGDDVNEWLSLVGFILSPSDFESFHMAIGEGLLTATHPVIWPWDGAAEIWGRQWLVENVDEARDMVLANRPIEPEAAAVLKALDPSEVARKWAAIIAP